jgi:lipocalin
MMAPRQAPLLLTACVVLLAGLQVTEARPAWWPFGGGKDGATRCPPPGYDAVKGLNLTEYVRAPWYIYSQMPNSYQPISSLYCVRAQYTLLDAQTVEVRNYANAGAVNGPSSGTSGAANATFSLRARIPDPAQPAKLLVGPDFLPAVEPLYGQYWVVAVGGGPSSINSTAIATQGWSNEYSWAVVTGGPPHSVGQPGTCYNGCEWYRGCLGSLISNGEGFWILTRAPVPTPGTIAAAEGAATALGLDMSKLVFVPQAGCMYLGA